MLADCLVVRETEFLGHGARGCSVSSCCPPACLPGSQGTQVAPMSHALSLGRAHRGALRNMTLVTAPPLPWHRSCLWWLVSLCGSLVPPKPHPSSVTHPQGGCLGPGAHTGCPSGPAHLYHLAVRLWPPWYALVHVRPDPRPSAINKGQGTFSPWTPVFSGHSDRTPARPTARPDEAEPSLRLSTCLRSEPAQRGQRSLTVPQGGVRAAPPRATGSGLMGDPDAKDNSAISAWPVEGSPDL